ncbi:MAG: SRPBCC domain-containing protein [Mangrovibacterium sp.]
MSEINAAIQVLKPAHEVFEAIVDPKKMSNYFIASGSGRMEEGKQVIWRFPEFDMDFPILVGKTENDRFLSFYWDVAKNKHIVEISLTSKEEINATVVRVTEKSAGSQDPGIEWLKGNTEGWANFLACLKAYLEYGINLRKGAFDFRNDEFVYV